MTALLRRSVAQARYVLGGSLVVLCGFQLIIVGQAAEIQRTQSFGGLADLMPIFLKQGLGNRVMLLASFRGIVAFGYFHPVICALLAMVAIYIATEPAHEIESGLVDLELARSLPRHRLLTRSLLLVVLAVAAGLSLMFAGTSIGARLFDAPIAAAAIRRGAAVAAGDISARSPLCFGSIGLWLASVSRRWTTAFTTGALLMLVTYLLDFLAIGWAPMRHVAWISPFHYYPALAIVAGEDAGLRNLLVLLSSAVRVHGRGLRPVPAARLVVTTPTRDILSHAPSFSAADARCARAAALRRSTPTRRRWPASATRTSACRPRPATCSSSRSPTPPTTDRLLEAQNAALAHVARRTTLCSGAGTVGRRPPPCRGRPRVVRCTSSGC